MPNEHSSRQYELDLETIRSRVLQMGGLVEKQFHDAMLCFRTLNVSEAERIIAADEEVNTLEVQLDDTCSHLIVKRQPAANDLRTVMATIKIITDLERVVMKRPRLRVPHARFMSGVLSRSRMRKRFV